MLIIGRESYSETSRFLKNVVWSFSDVLLGLLIVSLLIMLLYVFVCWRDDNMSNLSNYERLKNAIKHQPDRYLLYHNTDSVLVEVHDCDTGRIWVKLGNDWVWTE